jgi:LytS/YehU family sensor histidine kinase
MRYALLNDSDSDGRVLLNKELEHIRNIIKMNQLRFDNKLNIQMEISRNQAGIKILPLILITITENAFKHGDIRNEKVPLTIRLRVEEDYIYFTCSNKKKVGPKELSFGIGLNNTRKRLTMVYGNKAVMEIKDSSDIYEITLKIPVSND